MYELKPEDARDLARMLGEIDHDNELQQLKAEQERQKLELLKVKTEKARQEIAPKPQKQTENRRSELAYIITLFMMFASVLISFIFLIYLIKKY